jgi:hypothetical protein
MLPQNFPMVCGDCRMPIIIILTVHGWVCDFIDKIWFLAKFRLEFQARPERQDLKRNPEFEQSPQNHFYGTSVQNIAGRIVNTHVGLILGVVPDQHGEFPAEVIPDFLAFGPPQKKRVHAPQPKHNLIIPERPFPAPLPKESIFFCFELQWVNKQKQYQ